MVPEPENTKENNNPQAQNNTGGGSTPGTSMGLTPPTSPDFLMISIQLQQDEQNQRLQQQQQQNLDNQAKGKNKIKLLPIVPTVLDKANMQKMSNAFNEVSKLKLNATCIPMLMGGGREDNKNKPSPFAYKFKGPDKKKLARKFLEKLQRELKEEKRLNKEAEKNAMKVSIKGEGIEGMKDAVEISHAMHGGDPASLAVGAVPVAMKIGNILAGDSSGGGEEKPEGKKSKAFGIPSTRDKPDPFGL